MSDIFLSYKSEDRQRAKVIAEALERHGYSVWLDQKIPPGKTYDEFIKEAIDAAKCVIVLWSKEAVKLKKGRWVRTEATIGDRRGILVPVLIDDVEPPIAFMLTEAAKLIDWDGTLPNPEFDLLLNSVAEKVGRPPKQNMRNAKEYIRESIAEFEVQGPLNGRERPAKGGWSIGNMFSTRSVGTLGCLVRDNLDSHKIYILSTASQIAPPGAKKGDPILQPGPIDGGRHPQDVIATLDRWKEPMRRKTKVKSILDRWLKPGDIRETNLDVAIAIVNDPNLVSHEIEGVGHIAGVADAKPRMKVMKVGRTTGLTFGKVRNVDVTLTPAGYWEDEFPIFRDVIQCDAFSSGGDNGAILMNKENYALGILFASTEEDSFFLPIQRVLDALNVSLFTDK